MDKYVRSSAEKKYNQYYSRLKSDHCIYCGDVKEHTDHIPSLKVTWSVGMPQLITQGTQLLIVDSCANCNLILQIKGMTLFDKFNVLIKAHEQYLTAAKLRSIPKGWSLDELAELDYSLLTYVLSSKGEEIDKQLIKDIKDKMIRLKKRLKRLLKNQGL